MIDMFERGFGRSMFMSATSPVCRLNSGSSRKVSDKFTSTRRLLKIDIRQCKSRLRYWIY